jgi:amino acid adenylation domain-containing protein
MQTAVFEPRAPLSEPPLKSQEEVRARAVTAVSAFALLACTCAREDDLSITMTTVQGRAPARVRVTLRPKMPLSALVDQVARRLASVRGLEPEVVIDWSNSAHQDADDRVGMQLSLAVDLRFLTVNVSRSRQRGLLKLGGAVAQLARHFRTAAAAVQRRSKTAVADVELLGPVERNRLLHKWSRTESALEIGARAVHELFEARAGAQPDGIAVASRDSQLTYRELDDRAERLAAGLRARGIGKGSFVAIQVPPSPNLYVAILGVLKSGAAYVPLDLECPPDRTRHVLSKCPAAVLLTVSARAGSLRDSAPCPIVCLDEDWDRVLPVPDSLAPIDPPGPNDLCYVIYTSGSTGEPKGVAVEHGSVVNLVCAEQRLFDVQPSDRVLQGFSIAFDAAVEEIWLAFAAGATLVPAAKEVLLSDLPQYLAAWGVTVFSTVPTLLATIDGYLPTVRLLIVGGEPCPQELVRRWATPERAMFNTYGPTEATVITTSARLYPGQPVTIGRPIPNSVAYILDEDGRLTLPGVAGEICIGGIGLARGYLNNDDLTASSFVANPFARERDAPGRLYKTGDRGRYDAQGNIEFCGRIDDQIKIRGCRVELGEIEAALVGRGDLVHVQVTMREDTPGAKHIVAYVVPREGVVVSEHQLKEELTAQLPAYMIPARIEVLERLPTLASGKVDKRSLPPPSRPPCSSGPSTWATPLERKIGLSWIELFGWSEVPRDAHFFLDLGGDSLMVAQMVSRLRHDPELRSLSVIDVYEHPTLASLGAHHAPGARPEVAGLSSGCSETAPSQSTSPARGNYLLCGVAQLAGLYLVFGVYSIQWLAPYLAYVGLRSIEAGIGVSLLATAAAVIAAQPLLLLLAVATKWLVIGRYKPGRHPLWGTYFFRFWLVDRVLAFAPIELLTGTPLLPAYCRLLGARIGSDVYLGSPCLNCFDLASIGDDTSIGADADLSGYAIEDGTLVVGSVRVGARCTIGSRSVLSHDAVLHDDVTIGELSLLPPGAVVPSGERWAGSPARRVGAVDREAPIARPTRRQRAVFAALFALGSLVVPAFVVGAFLPGLVGLNYLERRWGTLYLLATPAVGAAFVVFLCLQIAAFKWLIVGEVKPGHRELYSGFYLRLWVFNRAIEQSLEVLGGLYATLFLNPWYRLLGVRLGRNAEVSTAPALAPDLLDIADEAFIADAVSLGTPAVERGYVRLDRTYIGKRAFVGKQRGRRIGHLRGRRLPGRLPLDCAQRTTHIW